MAITECQLELGSSLWSHLQVQQRKGIFELRFLDRLGTHQERGKEKWHCLNVTAANGMRHPRLWKFYLVLSVPFRFTATSVYREVLNRALFRNELNLLHFKLLCKSLS